MNTRRGIVLIAVLGVAACKAKHPPSPEPDVAPSVEPMPVAPPVATVPPVAIADALPVDAKPGPPITIAPFTSPGSPGVGARSLELRRDGTILFGGKEHGKIDRDKVVDPEGSTILRVSADDTLIGGGDETRFVGDELQRGADARFAVKDGAFVATIAGKKTVVAKVTGGQSAKRAVILVFLARELQDLTDGRAAMQKTMAAQMADLDKPCIPDPSKPPGNCMVTPMTDPPPPPPPDSPSKKPRKRDR